MNRFASSLLLLLVGAGVTAEELRTLGGKTIRGTLQEITESDIVLKTDEGEVATPLSQALMLDFPTPKQATAGKGAVALRLLDDTMLHCKLAVIKGKDVHVVLPSGLAFKLPLNRVLSLQQDAGNPKFEKQWAAIASAKVRRDRIVILRDGAPNVLEGALGEADAQGKTIQFKLEGAPAYTPVLVERLHGLVFWRPDPAPETPLCKVIDRDGNTLYALKLGVHEGTLNVHTTFDAKLPFKFDALAKLDFNLGKLTFLSDMDPAKVIEKSAIGLIVRYKRDSNLDGEPIHLDKPYAKGLSMHAHTELEYQLGGKFKDLKGVLGIDPRIGVESAPLVTILCDGEKRFSEVITPGAVRPVALAINDVQTLKIVVSSRNFLDLHDHVTFADARVSQ